MIKIEIFLFYILSEIIDLIESIFFFFIFGKLIILFVIRIYYFIVLNILMIGKFVLNMYNGIKRFIYIMLIMLLMYNIIC